MVDWQANTHAMKNSIRICILCIIYRKWICDMKYAEYATWPPHGHGARVSQAWSPRSALLATGQLTFGRAKQVSRVNGPAPSGYGCGYEWRLRCVQRRGRTGTLRRSMPSSVDSPHGGGGSFPLPLTLWTLWTALHSKMSSGPWRAVEAHKTQNGAQHVSKTHHILGQAQAGQETNRWGRGGGRGDARSVFTALQPLHSWDILDRIRRYILYRHKLMFTCSKESALNFWRFVEETDVGQHTDEAVYLAD